MALSYNLALGAITDTPCGSWYSTSTFTSTATNTEYILGVNNQTFARDITVVDGSKFTVSNTGLYNFQFSAQVHNTGGGGNSAAIEIWLKKNGASVQHTGTRVSATSNHPYVVASWNFFEAMAVGDYLELAFDVNHAGINIVPNTAIAPGSDIPSLIVTMNQVG